MSNDHDEKPDVNDPELDAFTNVMTDGAEGKDETRYGIIEPNYQNAHAIQHALGDRLAVFLDENPETMHLEVLTALANMFCGVTDHYLARFDLDLFAVNQQQVLQLVGRIAYEVNAVKPTEQQLAEVPLPPLVTLN